MKSTSELLLNGGFQQLAFEDFYDTTLSQLEQIPDSDPDLLLVNFQTEEISNSIVMHLRFVASAYLKIHSAEYEPFLIVEAISIDQFCAQEVEAFGRESDHLHIIALTKALDVPVEVIYLDGSSGDHAAVHEFWPDESAKGSRKPLQLIYRPGVYFHSSDPYCYPVLTFARCVVKDITIFCTKINKVLVLTECMLFERPLRSLNSKRVKEPVKWWHLINVGEKLLSKRTGVCIPT